MTGAACSCQYSLMSHACDGFSYLSASVRWRSMAELYVCDSSQAQ
jgi:hypothetical protein